MNNSRYEQLQNSSSTGLENPSYSTLMANIVINGCLCYTTIMLNIVTIHALWKTSLLPKPLKTLLLSLAFSDLGVGLLSQPLYIAHLVENLRYNSPVKLHNVLYFISDIFYLSTFCSITALGVDRFVAIQMPLRYQELVTHKRVVIVIVAVWICSAFIAGLSIVFVGKWNVYFWIFFTVKSVCFVATIWTSYKVYLTLKRHNTQRNLRTEQVIRNSDMINVAITRIRKSNQTTFWIYLVFLICYLPNFLVFSVAHLTHAHPQSGVLGRLSVFSWTLVLLNSSLNPVIYCWTMRQIRQTIMAILRTVVSSGHRHY